MALAAGCGTMLPAAASSAQATAPSPQAAAPSAQEIVRQSVVNNERNWKAAPEFAFFERDIVISGGTTKDRTYETMMIEGSPYQKLIARNGQPLSPQDAATQERKLQETILRRKSESAADRQARVAKYQRGRRQDHALMQQMTKAFDFRLRGQEIVNGRLCYVLDGTPRPDYEPINRDTEVLKGMRGRLWVDTKEFQWVKVHAEVFRPVKFGLFIAKVQPGTEFTLEEGPVGGGLWMPSRFDQEVKAQVLLFWNRNSSEHDTYWGYKRTAPAQPQARMR